MILATLSCGDDAAPATAAPTAPASASPAPDAPALTTLKAEDADGVRYWIDVAPTTPGGRRVVAVEPADPAAASRPATPLDPSAAARSVSFVVPRGVVPRVRVRFADGGEAVVASPPG